MMVGERQVERKRTEVEDRQKRQTERQLKGKDF